MFCGNCDFETNLLIVAIHEERLNLKLENLGTCFDPTLLFLADILLGQSHLSADPGFSHISIFVYINLFKETNRTPTAVQWKPDITQCQGTGKMSSL